MKIYKDVSRSKIEPEYDSIRIELGNQEDKWGQQNRSMFEWLTYLTEEVGELAKEISEYEYCHGAKEHISNEAIQVATLAVRISAIIKQDLQIN